MATCHSRRGSDPSCKLFASGAVSCDSEIASDAGREMLSRGGSAIDAAIATLLVNGMSNAHSMGLGGGFFMVYYDASTNTAYSIDAREAAPLYGKATHSIAVPTEVIGYREAHKRWGRLPWKVLFAPAIRYATDGIKVSPAFARAIRIVYGDLTNRNLTALKQQLTNESTGKPYVEGEVIKWPSLARSLEALSNEQFDSYLSDVCADLKDLQSTIVKADFDNYKVRVATPLAFHVPPSSTNGSNDGSQSFTVVSHPPPSGGCIVSLILNLLSGALQSSKEEPCDTLDATANFFHRYIECVKLAYPAYEFVGDAAFHPEVKDSVKRMLDPLVGKACGGVITDSVVAVNFMKAYQHMADLIGANSCSELEKNPSKLGLNVDYGGTAHACIVAPNGDAVSITSSINHYFGSRLMGSRTGVIWNNTIEDFAYVDRERFRLAVSSVPQRHFIDPGKRPVSAMSPIIVISSPVKNSSESSSNNNSSTTNHCQPRNDHDNNSNDEEQLPVGLRFPNGSNAYMLCGGAGGSRIVGAVSYVLAQALFAPQPILLSKAIQAPRVRHWIHNSGSSLLVLEAGFCCELRRRLETRGHLIEEETERYLTVISGIQMVREIEQKPFTWLACCDARKGGCPAGF